jgi:ABC-type sugar transport system substrate-binding protein
MFLKSLKAAAIAATFALPATAVRADDIVIGYSMDALENDIWRSVATMFEADMKALGEKLGHNITVQMLVADGDVGRQNAQIRDLIGLQPAVIFMAPKDSKAIVTSIAAAQEAGIPVVTHIRDSDPAAETRPNAFLGIDAFHQGYSTAKALFEIMKADGVTDLRVINVMGDLGDENAVLRSEGLYKAAEEAGATVLQDVPTGWDPDKALSGLSAALQAHPDATAVFVASDHLIQGVKTALERADRWAPRGDAKHMYLGSQDVFPIAIQMVADGYIDANTVFDIGVISKQAAAVVELLIAGQPVEPIYKLEGRVATRENIADLPDLWSRPLAN